MKYKVTVIIPSFNSEEFLEETIQTIINQTIGFENIELIINDDFSTDSSPEIINSYCEKYENINSYPLKSKSGSPGTGRNIGIANAKGEYIMFADHDDHYSEDAVENLYTSVSSEKYGLANEKSKVGIAKFQTFGDAEVLSDLWLNEDTIISSISENTNFLTINNIWRMIFPKEFLIQNNIIFPENMFAEDLAFMMESFLKAEKIVFINEISYYFRLRQGEACSTSTSKGIHYLGGLSKGYFYTKKILEENNGMEYYTILFNKHLSCWLNDLINSKTIKKEEKYELLNETLPLFTELKTIDSSPFDIQIHKIMELLNKEKLDDAIIAINNIKTPEELNLEKELAKNQKKVDNLKNTKSWLKYKTKNLIKKIKK